MTFAYFFQFPLYQISLLWIFKVKYLKKYLISMVEILRKKGSLVLKLILYVMHPRPHLLFYCMMPTKTSQHVFFSKEHP